MNPQKKIRSYLGEVPWIYMIQHPLRVDRAIILKVSAPARGLCDIELLLWNTSSSPLPCQPCQAVSSIKMCSECGHNGPSLPSLPPFSCPTVTPLCSLSLSIIPPSTSIFTCPLLHGKVTMPVKPYSHTSRGRTGCCSRLMHTLLLYISLEQIMGVCMWTPSGCLPFRPLMWVEQYMPVLLFPILCFPFHVSSQASLSQWSQLLLGAHLMVCFMILCQYAYQC